MNYPFYEFKCGNGAILRFYSNGVYEIDKRGAVGVDVDCIYKSKWKIVDDVFYFKHEHSKWLKWNYDLPKHNTEAWQVMNDVTRIVKELDEILLGEEL